MSDMYIVRVHCAILYCTVQRERERVRIGRATRAKKHIPNDFYFIFSGMSFINGLEVVTILNVCLYAGLTRTIAREGGNIVPCCQIFSPHLKGG